VGILPQPQRHVFAQDSGRDMFVIGVHDRSAEDTFRLEYTLRVIAQSAMSKVTHELLAGVEPVMRRIVLGLAPTASGGGGRRSAFHTGRRPSPLPSHEAKLIGIPYGLPGPAHHALPVEGGPAHRPPRGRARPQYTGLASTRGCRMRERPQHPQPACTALVVIFHDRYGGSNTPERSRSMADACEHMTQEDLITHGCE
jgi:hypothetical protein